jgi:hypothetical protein
MIQWLFERHAQMGGANADAFRNTLAGQGLEEEHLFIREAIQNSVDAALADGTRVNVRLVDRRLTGVDLDSFLSALRLDAAGNGPRSRRGVLGTSEQPERGIDDVLRGGLRVLCIEDHGTVGLTGGERVSRPSRDDRFRNLCLELGSTPPPEAGRGGTFGYGKSVYWVASKLWTVVLYSRFTPAHQDTDARLMGVSWFRAHTHPEGSDAEENQFTGRAWLGEVDGDEARPLRGDEAHEFASRLGIAPRDEGDTGTSILILGCDVDLDNLREGVERWWWPRILTDKLAVEIVHADGSIRRPSPRHKPVLGRYIRAWDLLHASEIAGDNDAVESVTYHSRELGCYAITSEGSDSDAPYPDEDEDHVLSAMIREPGMVVHYAPGPVMSAGHPMCAGVFVANAELDITLAKSEPPGHNLWDWKSTRRDRSLSDVERQRIELLYKKVRESAHAYLKTHREPPPQPPDRCEELERFLGRYLGHDRGRPPQPPRTPDPFRVWFLDGPSRVERNGAVRVEARVRLAPSEHSTDDVLRLRCIASLVTIVDRGSPGDRLPMQRMARENGGFVEDPRIVGRRTEALLELHDEEDAIVILESEPLPHPGYRADLELLVERVEPADGE